MKILMRMGMSPLDNCDLYKVIDQDTIGSNIGNMLFPYSILRGLYNDDAEGDKKVEVDGYMNADVNDAEMINREYDMFIIPLANAFRDTFVVQLSKLTELIKRLTIPCVVVGVGLQDWYEPNINAGYIFDDTVREFMDAVLEKSNSVGVRGEITAAYLKRLGYTESQVEVIGCPSMYMHGDFLPMKNSKELTKDSVVTMNYHGNHMNFYQLLERTKMEFPNYYIIPQLQVDLRLLYGGDSIKDIYDSNPYYIKDTEYRSFRDNRVRMFINVPSWINFMDKADVTMGTCIHGSISSVLAGNPTIVFGADSRVRELAEYHNLALWKITDINEKTSLRGLYESTDFSKVLVGHKERFDNYVSFMKRNNITIHPYGWKKDTSFDKRMQKLDLHEPNGVESYMQLPYKEQLDRLQTWLKIIGGKLNWWERQPISKEAKLEGRKNWELAKQEVMRKIEKIQ